MSASAFTPGPWSVNCSHIYAPDGAIIAVVHNPGSKPSDYPLVANRDLMAAAPELYETLKKLSFMAQTSAGTAGRDEQLVEAIHAGNVALAKARGDQ